MPDIISIGECMVELYSDQPIATTPSFHKAYGGDTLNVLVAASRLGSSTGYVTRLGNDPFASYLAESWREEAVDLSQVKTVEGFNGIYFISLLPGGQREFTYYRRGSTASTLQPSDLDPAYVGSAKVLHVSGISQAISPSCRRTVLAGAKLAHEQGVLVSYDPNLRLKLWPSLAEARAALREILPYADIILPSGPEETRMLLDAASPEDAVERLWREGVRIVAVKRGPEGCLLGCDGRMTAVAPFTPDEVVDTTGAGDAFAGAFLHGLMEGMREEDAAALAVIAAGLNLRSRGAIAGLPHREEAYALFSRGVSNV